MWLENAREEFSPSRQVHVARSTVYSYPVQLEYSHRKASRQCTSLTSFQGTLCRPTFVIYIIWDRVRLTRPTGCNKPTVPIRITETRIPVLPFDFCDLFTSWKRRQLLGWGYGHICILSTFIFNWTYIHFYLFIFIQFCSELHW